MHKGISEITSAIIIIAVVVSGLGIYTGLSQQRILGDMLSVKEIINQRDEQISELVKIIGVFDDATPDVVQIIVHNYGLKDIIISEVFVNGEIKMSEDASLNSFFVRDLNEIPISPNSRSIPQGKTSAIILDFSAAPGPTADSIENLVIQTDSNKLIQFLNE